MNPKRGKLYREIEAHLIHQRRSNLSIVKPLVHHFLTSLDIMTEMGSQPSYVDSSVRILLDFKLHRLVWSKKISDFFVVNLN